jgi:hypothetical protein
VPGAGELAPLSHLVIHAQDVRQPLGLPALSGSGAAVRVLDDITGGRHSVGERVLGGLRFTATDVDWASGESGPTVEGPSAVLLSALNGRDGSAATLHGDGAAEPADRSRTAAASGRHRAALPPVRPGAAGAPTGSR